MTIESHRTLFYLLIGLFEALQVASIGVLWSMDPRRFSPWSEAAGITGLFSLVGLFTLGWMLRRGAPRLASICLLSGIVGLVCSMIFPAIP